MEIVDSDIELALKNIGQILTRLDLTEKNIDLMTEDNSDVSIKKWFVEKKAITEIKEVMARVGKYDYYESQELNDFEKYLQCIIM